MQHQGRPVLSSTLTAGPDKLYIQAVTQVPVLIKQKHNNSIAHYNIDRTLRTLIGHKPMFYQSIKHTKSVFYCFTHVKSIS